MKKVFLFILMIVLMLICETALADTKSDLFTYEIKGNGTVKITGFDWKNNGEKDVYIPRMIDGYTVTEIGSYAFSSESATKNFDTTIGYPVIVIMPDTITVIGEKAFFCTNITALTIPKSVQLIGSGAFAGCVNIKKFNVDPENKVYTVIQGILYDKQKKELVSCPISYTSWNIPEGIVSLGDYAFAGCKCDTYSCLDFPDSLRIIGKYAFYRIDFTNFRKTRNEVYFDLKNVTVIDDYAFAQFNTSLYWIAENVKEIHAHAFEDTTMYYFFSHEGVEKTALKMSLFPSVESIGNYAFKNARLRNNAYNKPYNLLLVFPQSLRQIGEGAFFNFLAREYVNSSEGALMLDFSESKIANIPQYTFARCRIAGILFPRNVESIGEYAFYKYDSYWPSLSKLPLDEIPCSVKKIDSYAFSESEHAHFEEKPFSDLSIDSYAFYNASYAPSLPEGLISIGEKAFWGVKDSTIIIPMSVTSIGNQFCDRSKTTLKVIPGSYGAIYASENGYMIEGNEDTSWLNN